MNLEKLTERANILLVDDTPARLLTYEAILGSLGHNLIRARSGDEALARLLETEVATILLDVSMPGLDGFETAALIRGHPRSAQTPTRTSGPTPSERRWCASSWALWSS